MTPLWKWATSQASVALLELPLEDTPDQAALAAALSSVNQPQAQVLMSGTTETLEQLSHPPYGLQAKQLCL